MQRTNTIDYNDIILDDSKSMIIVDKNLAVSLIKEYTANQGVSQASRDLTEDGRLRGIDLKTPKAFNNDYAFKTKAGKPASTIVCTSNRYEDFKNFISTKQKELVQNNTNTMRL